MTIWTAIDDTTPENGALQIAPGSHKHGPLEFGSTMSFEPTLTPEREAELTGRKIMLPMKRGVSRHDIAAIWVAFLSGWQRYRC